MRADTRNITPSEPGRALLLSDAQRPGPSRLIVAGVLAPMLALALFSLTTELDIRAAEQRLAARASADMLAQLDHTTSPARAAALDAVLSARVAATRPSPSERRALADTALLHADRAIAGRPASANAWLARAYALTVRDGMHSTAAIAAFARSYVEGGYLRDAADWRLRFAAANWDALDAETRARAAQEGQWLGSLSPRLRVHVYVLTGHTPLYRAISGSDAPPPRHLFR